MSTVVSKRCVVVQIARYNGVTMGLYYVGIFCLNNMIDSEVMVMLSGRLHYHQIFMLIASTCLSIPLWNIQMCFPNKPCIGPARRMLTSCLSANLAHVNVHT